ncbi:MAG: OmpA family protein [Acidobacteria bacterium]|nr:OmpA family protein [Acidobacteriota bacterium]
MSPSYRLGLALMALVVVGACASTPRARMLPPPPVPLGEIGLAEAITFVAADLTAQLGDSRTWLLAVDPLLDKTTGQQTVASLRVQDELMQALSTTPSLMSVQDLGADTAEQTGLVGTGTLAPGDAPGRYLLNVALTDRASGIVVAQSVARFREPNLDRSPTAFYRDSPSVVRDRTVEGYVRTAETPSGRLADALYVEQLPTEALMATALDEYNAGRYDTALTAYTTAAARPNGQTLRTFNGLYLTNMRLNRAAEAEEAFGRIVTLGLATNNLAVKLLFLPGTTNFLADANFSGAYPMWIRQISRGASASRACLHIVGNTSASGTLALNEALSLARATAVRDLLQQEAPALAGRLRVSGVGPQRNIVGTGADDASDAIDRRVEFEVEDCRP